MPTFVRPLADVVTAAERALFPEKDVAAAGALLVGLLKPPVDPGAQKRLNALDPSQHTFKIAGNELYWLCKVKQSETRLTPGPDRTRPRRPDDDAVDQQHPQARRQALLEAGTGDQGRGPVRTLVTLRVLISSVTA